MNHISIKKGHDIRLSGIPGTDKIISLNPKKVALMPIKFRGVKPKLMVQKGDEVSAGTPLFFDKNKPEIKWASPMGGIVSDIQIGARRVIEKIEVDSSDGKENSVVAREPLNLENADGKTVKKYILDSNVFPLIRQRPFNKIPDPNIKPRDIFISGVGTAPLAVDIGYLISQEKQFFQAALTGLSKLTDGSVYLTLREKIGFSDVQEQTISGPHPSGNVGIQIHHTKPLKPDDIIWTISPQHVVTLGKLFKSGIYSSKILITIGGSGSSQPSYVETNTGANIGEILSNQENTRPVRLISGDVLTGATVQEDNFIGYYDTSVAMIDDDVKRPFLGMLSLGSNKTKYSLTNTFLSFGKQDFNFTTSQNGELRSIVPLNAWEKYLPMDILPNPLYRSILSGDIEEMEKLGIIECDDEDFALCSFACPSKIDVGSVIRQGLDLMEKEG